MTPRISSRRHSERGTIAATTSVFVVVLCGLAFAVLTEVTAAKKVIEHGEADMRALEAAETGIALAEVEISSKQDPDKDGLGTLTSTYAGSRFAVVATQDLVLADQWTMHAQGFVSTGGRQVDVRIRRVPVGAWNYGMFAGSSITIANGSTTDAYDSRKGNYLSQVKNSDKFGNYAQASGGIGSNGSIILQSSEIRGDSSAGPGFKTSLFGTAGVTGSTAPLKKAVAIPDTPLATFVAAATFNDNGSWKSTGGVTYDPVKKILMVAGGNTLTLTKSTYFFSKIILSGNSTLMVTGPVQLYVTDQIDFSGGVVVNTIEKPSSMQIYQEPYPLPVGYILTINTATLSGGSLSAFAYYAPRTPVTLSGKGTICGAVIGKSISESGGTPFHYDLALLDEMDHGNASIERIYWRDAAPPMR